MLDRQGLLIAFVRGVVVVTAGVALGVFAIFCLLLLSLLSGCASAPAVKSEPLPVRQYVPVPKELLKRCAWTKTAPPKDVFPVSRQRKACLEQYEGQLDGIEGLK